MSKRNSLLRWGIALVVLGGAAFAAWTLMQPKQTETAPRTVAVSIGDIEDLLETGRMDDESAFVGPCNSGHDVEIDACRQNAAAIVIGMVAAYFASARGAENSIGRCTESVLELSFNRSIPSFLTQACRRICPIQLSQSFGRRRLGMGVWCHRTLFSVVFFSPVSTVALPSP